MLATREDSGILSAVTVETAGDDSEILSAEKTEKTTLLPPEDRTKHIVNNVAQVTLAIVGLGAGALYFGPAQTCASIQECGKWLADLTSKKIAVGILTAGGIDFSAGAALMAAEGVDTYTNYIARQTSMLAKVGKGTLVIVFAASQTIPLLLASLRTNSAFWQTPVTIGGALPGAVYGAIHTTQDIFPYYLSVIQQFCSNLLHTIRLPKDKTEEMVWARISYLRKAQTNFLEQVDMRWQYVLENPEKIDTIDQRDPISFLFSPQIVPLSKSRLSKGVHEFGTLSGLLMAVNFSVGGISNTFHQLMYVPTTPLKALATGFFNISQFYGNARLGIAGLTAILDTFADLFEGKPIHSLLYRLQPKTTSLVVGGSLAASALSYAVIAVLYYNEFGVNPGLYGAMAGVDIYHFGSIFHLYHLLFSRLTSDQKQQFLLSVEKEIARLNFMTESEWVKVVTENPQKFAELGITPPPLPSQIEEKATSDEASDKEEKIILDVPGESTKLQPEKKSPQSFWARLFGWKSKDNSEEVQPKNYQTMSQ